MSFRTRLTLLVALAIAITVAAASAVVWVVAKHQLRSQVDATLVTQAGLAAAGHNDPFTRLSFIVLHPDGTVDRQTLNAPVTDAERQGAIAVRGSFFQDTTSDDVHARVLVDALSHGGAVIVASDLRGTDHALARI